MKNKRLSPRLQCLLPIAASIALLLLSVHAARADEGAKIKVMTQNQYIGANLEPLVTADSPAAFNAALVSVLQTVAASDYPARVRKLVQTIVDDSPDLVGLQEMWSFGCIPASATIPDPCGIFGPAFNDHLDATLEALTELDSDYYVAAQVRNLTIPDADFPLPAPGIPVFLDDVDLLPDIFLTVMDRDVILARGKVATTPVSFACAKPSLDGCNFEFVAAAEVGGIPLSLERGFVAVDAVVRGHAYRFVNTHLEVRFPDPSNPLSRAVQSVQATELIGILWAQPAPANSRLIVVGDINSAPDDPYPSPTTGPFLTPYQQFVSGRSFAGAPISAPYHDVWTLRKKDTPGLTCCEDADLRNPISNHDRRIDVVFSLARPDKAKARVLNTEPSDRTASGRWPSDHATVAAKLRFDGGEMDDDS